jgi:amino acid adenylation domain-containing protein
MSLTLRTDQPGRSNEIRRVKAERFRASPQQEHLWCVQRVDDSPAYRSLQAVLIEGKLDTDLLVKALRAVVNRHEILRTTFQYVPERARLVQTVADTASTSVEEFSYNGWGIQDQESAVSLLFDDLRQRSFDFERGPLLHTRIITLSPEKHVFLASLSALCSDAATVSNFFAELGDAYSCRSRDDRDSEKRLQYADYAQWQHEVLESDEANAGRRYWRRKYLSLQPGLELPFRALSAAPLPFEPASSSFKFDMSSYERLQALGEFYETPLPVFLLTAWIVLLWRITGRPDPVVGVRCDGRRYAELDKALGLFARYLPLQCNLDAGLRFEEILKTVRQSAEDVYRWQESFSWEQAVNSRVGPAAEPFCSASFESVPKQTSRSFGTKHSFSIVIGYECIERFEVKLCCNENDGCLGVELHFDSSLFRVEDIKRLGERLQILLEAAIANPVAEIGELQILTAQERHQLLVEFNDSESADVTGQLVHELFEQQTRRTPESTAAVYEDQHVTYAALSRRANQLAHHLRERGVGPEAPVALCTERGIDMLAGLLAVLKAGGAYVPLDPGYPKDRLQYMLQDCRATIVLTQSRLAKDMPQTGAEIVCLDSEWEWIRPGFESDVAAEVSPQNLAYIIYTSGSTGQPKGVAVEHRQLVNYSKGIATRMNHSEGAGYAALTSLAADLGNTAIFPSLITGGCLHIVSAELVQDARALGEYFEDHHIENLKITPSHLAAVRSSRGGEPVMPRDTLVLGGEAMASDWLRQLKEECPHCTIINHYGPTETTVGALIYEIASDRSIEDATSNVPLGRPLANLQAYILDGTLGGAPVGIAAEIYLSGEGLSRGYLNRPDTTAEKFIPNPFVRKAGSRMYRTGDLARHRADGAIDFLGRVDYQVKIRGFRIELGEIEAVLADHPAVRSAVVLAREDRPGTKRLVGYIEARDGGTVRSEELWRHLRSRLPEYMVPSEYVTLQSLPLTANGKIDRRALPVPGESESGREPDFAPPRSELEEHLAEIWAEVLGLQRVSIHGNFFRLGGDSILSIQIVARARELGYHLTARDVFEHQTVSELAEAVSGKQTPGMEHEPITREISLLTQAAGALTPSDFPDVELTQEELDDLIAKFA